jgi:hypothetical protein
MGKLNRQVDGLITACSEGKFFLKGDDPDLKDLATDLSKVVRMANGQIDLETCTPLVRQMSRSLDLARRSMDQSESPCAEPDVNAGRKT